MQANPKIQYNEEDAGLTLDNPTSEPTVKPESSDAQDEADLVAAEQKQNNITVKGTQVVSSPRQVMQKRKNDRLIVAGCMGAGVMSVVVVYALIVFL